MKVDEVPAPMVLAGGLVVANHVSLISAGTERATAQVAQKSLLGKALERPEVVRKVLGNVRKDGVVGTAKLVWERLDSPVALGYSCAGTIVEVGREVQGMAVGERVACAGQNYASHAEIVYVPLNLCVKIPPGVDFEDAAFVTLGAIALQGIRQAEPRLGERVAVIGLGLLGQLTVQMLKASGCLVLGSDPDPARLQLAAESGADVITGPDSLADAAAAFTKLHGVDAVVITAGTDGNGPIEAAGLIARKKARVVVVGAVGMTIPREVYYRKELEVRLSMSYGPGRYDRDYEEKGRDYPYGYVRWTENRNMEAFLTLLQQKKVKVKPLVTHRFAIQDAAQAYTLMLERQTPYLGMLLSYPDRPDTKPDRVVSTSLVKRRDRPDQINLGVIGAGNHVRDRLLPALLAWRAVHLRGICSSTGIRAKAVAEKAKADYCTTDYREVLKDESVNAVLIGTRHQTHGVMVMEALAAGKHVFVEKPLCLTEDELDQITAVYRQKSREGLHLMVGFNRRFSPHAEKAREFFQDRTAPLVMTFRVNAGSLPADHWIEDPDVGGGRLIGEACHFVDYLQALCGAPPVSVHARGIGRRASGMVDDNSLLSMTFADGSIGAVVYASGGDTALVKERLEVFGDGRSLTMDDFHVSDFYAQGTRTTFRTREQDKGFQAEMDQFVAGIARGDAPGTTFDGIVAVTKTCLLAVRSQRTGQVYDIGV